MVIGGASASRLSNCRCAICCRGTRKATRSRTRGAHGEHQPRSSMNQKDNVRGIPGATMETARILVVDEPMHFREAIDGVLEKGEYAAVHSSGVQDAIARIDRDPPYDLILADLA